jgi:hypothetical protein
MADTEQAMHRDFPRWHAAVALGSEFERKKARWSAISALAENADRPMVEALVRLAFQIERHPPAKPCLDKIHEAFLAADDTFDPKNAARELQVFAGACLQLLLEQKNDIGAAAALSVTTAAFAGARIPSLPLDLVALAETALIKIADANRTRPALAISITAPEIDVEAAIDKVRREPSWESVAQALTSTASSFSAALQALAARQAGAIKAVDQFIQIQDEELQMLWWLTGGRSFDLDCAFDAVAVEAQPLVLAKELADSTTLLPGPRSIKALLARAGLKERKKLTVAAAINATDASWLSGLVDENPSPVTAPLHFAITRQTEAGGGETWVPNWSTVVGVDGARQIPSVVLAVQLYRERLLVLFG